jgi:hypothetical protein
MNAMSDFLPSNDLEFNNWLTQFSHYVEDHAAELGLTEAEIEGLLAGKPLWEESLDAHGDAQRVALGCRQTKDNRRKDMEAVIRPLSARIQSYSGTTDAARKSMGLTLRGKGVSDDSPDVLADLPVPIIDSSNRQVHTIRVRNKVGKEVRNARPSWTRGCEVWRNVGDAPSDVSDAQYVDTITRGRYQIEYSGEDAGQTVYYIFRWIGRNGEKGPWSQAQSAVIAA